VGRFCGFIAFAATLAGVSAAHAASVTVGVMLTLSGPSAVLGQHARDGFQLAMKQFGGQLGGVDANIVVVDDELDPELAVQKVRNLIDSDKIDVFVGVIYSNVMMAVYEPLVDARIIVVSPNSAPSPIAGPQCSPYFFATSWQNDQNAEVMGEYARGLGYRRVVAIAPDYQAGWDMIAGFKRYFRGDVPVEILTRLGQLDFSEELKQIVDAKPDALFAFMPGGMGVDLIRQYEAAGLGESIPFLSAFTIDEATLSATGDAAIGFFSGAQWAPDLENPANKRFVASFEAEYGYVPSMYAQQAYDAALLIDSAVRGAGGDLVDKGRLISAFERAEFQSTRGDFRFNTNHIPIQDFYLVQAVKRGDQILTSAVKKVFDDHADAYVGQCPMQRH
jgi:branched-chain amino acid transport system substrate-binding protein